MTTAHRAHGLRRRAVHSLVLRLARHRPFILLARGIVRDREGRVARVAALLDFVHRLAAADRAAGRPCSDDLAAAVLCALLRAAGERATVEYTRERVLLRVAVASADLALLPPWARVLAGPSGRLDLVLAPAGWWRAAGYVPPDARAALERRRPSLALAS